MLDPHGATNVCSVGKGTDEESCLEAVQALAASNSATNSRDPRHFDKIEGGRVYQELYVDSKSVLDALCRAPKKCLRRST